jgi:CelD/BcsL family acetyltransferase involved in cellulose biosynthesis
MLSMLDSPDTPFVDIPAAGAVDDVVAAVLGHLRSRRDWDVLALSKLPAHSKTLKALEAALPGQFRWRVAGTDQSPYLAINGSWEDFYRHKTQRFRKTCRNIENRILRSGEVTVEEHLDVDPGGPVFAELIEVSSQSWKGPAGLAIATMQGMQRFFREFTQRASARGWLHLWILRLNGRAVATEYQIGDDGSLHALRADFDAALAELSPGGYLNQRIVSALFQRKDVREYNMGPGANEYKLRWASDAHETVGLEIYAPRLWGRLLEGVEGRLVPLARRWRSRMGRA